jgi:glycine cleavage system H protein
MGYNKSLLTIPTELFYTKNHEWLVVDENVVTFGITEFATQHMGEILYVDLPDEGDRITIESNYGTLESVKNIMDFVGPFSGTVLEVNSRLTDDPSIINDDPYGEGWLFIAELESEKDLMNFLRHSEYKSFLDSRVKA